MSLSPLWSGRRFTPTCVGTTLPVDADGRGRLVHPHVRGDNARFSTLGSWPMAVHLHVRGDNYTSW